MTDNPVKSALALLKEHRGWHIFPIRSGAKYPPCFERNLELASNDPAVIRRWAKEFPGCNWGLSLKKSGLIVPDVDCKPPKVGRDTLERLELEHGLLPHTFIVRTPNGGLHYYFYEHAAVHHRMKLNAFGPDVDSTNYVLLPGSVLHGVNYKIIDHSPVIALAPSWFAEYLDAPEIGDNSQVPAVEQDTPDLIAQAIHFLTHDARPSVQFQNGEYALLMTAAMLKDIGISENTAVELLDKYYNVSKGDGNHPYCEPLWEVGEGATADRLDAKVRNAWQYLNQTQPGSRTAQVAFGDEPVDSAALDAMAAWWKEFDRKSRLQKSVCFIGGVAYPVVKRGKANT